MRVHIYCSARKATQSARGKVGVWIVEPVLQTPRLPESLMGWVCAEDTLSTLKGKLRFELLDDAMAFVHAQGWDYSLSKPGKEGYFAHNYQTNFKITRPEDEERAAYP